MEAIRNIYARAAQSERGQTMTEYAMILATVAIVVLSAYQLLGGELTTMLNSVDSLI